MTTLRDPDLVIGAWLASGPVSLSAETRGSIAAAVQRTRQRERIAPTFRRRIVLSRFQAVGLVAVAVVFALAVVASLSRRADEDPNVGPTQSVLTSTPSRTAPSPSVAASAEPATPDGQPRFVSNLYGYSMTLPTGWEAEPASVRWDGTGPWSHGPAADVFQTPGTPRFAVSAILVEGFTTADRWVGEHVPPPTEYEATADGGHACVFRTWSGVTAIDAPDSAAWAPSQIGDGQGVVRSVCGHVDGVAVVAGRAFVFTLYTEARADGDVAVFHTFTDTVRFAGVSQIDSDTWPSERYGYSIKPGECAVTAAGSAWAPGVDAWYGDVVSDQFCASKFGGRVMHIVSAVLPAGTDPVDWRTRVLPAHLDGTAFGGCGLEERADWRPWTVVHPTGMSRLGCGWFDGLVVIGDRAFVFSTNYALGNRTPSRPPLDEIDALLGTVVPEPQDTQPAADRFASGLYGYSVGLPGGWTAEPSTVAWIPGVSDRYDLSDVFDGTSADPEGSTIVLRIASAALSDGLSEDGWVTAYLPSMRSTDQCAANGDRPGGPPGNWLATTDDSVRKREVCGFAEAVVFTGGRAYVVSVQAPYARYPGASPGTRAVLEQFLASTEFHPEDPSTSPGDGAMGEAFTSNRYRYSVGLPAGSTVMPAVQTWAAAGPPTGAVADQFGWTDAVTFSVASVAVPISVDEPRWLGEVMPPRKSGPWGTCHPSGQAFESEPWESLTIAGLPARLRSACGFVDAVIFVEGRAYVFTADGRQVDFETAPETIEQFEAFVARVALDRPA